MFVLPAMSSKNLVKAELRVLKKRATEGELLRCEYSVMVHSFVSGKSPAKTFMDSLTVKNSLKGQWLEFITTTALKLTIQDSKRKLGFRLSTDGAACAEFDIGKRGRHKPFLVTYTRDEGDESSQAFLTIIKAGSKHAKPL